MYLLDLDFLDKKEICSYFMTITSQELAEDKITSAFECLLEHRESERIQIDYRLKQLEKK